MYDQFAKHAEREIEVTFDSLLPATIRQSPKTTAEVIDYLLKEDRFAHSVIKKEKVCDSN